MLRDLKGFQNEITVVTPGKTEALAISLWDNKTGVDACNHDKYPEVLRSLNGLLNGNPRIETSKDNSISPYSASPRAEPACR